jgi:hypothetical protein
LKTVGVVAFLCLLIYFVKVGKSVFGNIFVDTIGDVLSCFLLRMTLQMMMILNCLEIT